MNLLTYVLKQVSEYRGPLQTLADLLRVGLIREAHQCRREQRDLRELTRGRLRMIERRSRLQPSLWQRPPNIS